LDYVDVINMLCSVVVSVGLAGIDVVLSVVVVVTVTVDCVFVVIVVGVAVDVV
jgi:hypothetical protein